MDISGPTVEKNGGEYLWIFEWKLFHGATFQGRLTGVHRCPSHFHPVILNIQDLLHCLLWKELCEDQMNLCFVKKSKISA